MQQLTTKCDFIENGSMPQNGKLWHDFRSLGIGASEAGIVAGSNKWSTVLDLWAAKTGRETIPFEITPAIQHGIDTEPEAREQFIKATNLNITPVCAISNRNPFCRASLDGISDCYKIIVEIKCPSALGIHMNTIKGVIPEYYYAQLQHQLYVVSGTLCCFWSYVPSMGGFLIEVKPNLPYIAELVYREKKLWNCITNDIEPNPADYPPMRSEYYNAKFNGKSLREIKTS